MQGLKGWWIDCYDLLQDPAHHCVHAHRANTTVATGGEPSKEQHLVQLSKKTSTVSLTTCFAATFVSTPHLCGSAPDQIEPGKKKTTSCYIPEALQTRQLMTPSPAQAFRPWKSKPWGLGLESVRLGLHQPQMFQTLEACAPDDREGDADGVWEDLLQRGQTATSVLPG